MARITSRLVTVGSLAAIVGALAGNACASGGEAESGAGGGGGKSGKGGTAAVDGGGSSGTGVGGFGGGTGGSAAASTGGAGGTAAASTGGAGGTAAASTGGTGAEDGSLGAGGNEASAGQAGAAGQAGGAGDAGGNEDAGNGEICNGLDDNGNGQIDEGNPGGAQACTVNGKVGQCAAGTTHCVSGIIVCQSTNQPVSEICDGLDNNCNGSSDEGISTGINQPCTTSLPGICASGTTKCVGGSIECEQNTQALAAEVCNLLDDNCNGQIDEANPGGGANCDTGEDGVCAAGITDCVGGQLQCVQQVQQGAEVCDAKDNDCDGTVDNPGSVTGLVCTTSHPGVCAPGKTQCAAGVGSCIPDVAPGSQLELCDAKDNDCDTTTDEDVPADMCARNCNPGNPAPPPIPNITSLACNTGACIITACPSGKKNSNGNFCDGCEATGCIGKPINDCITANTLSLGVPETARLLNTGEVVWYKVTFSNPGQPNPFKPSVTLSGGATDYRMDVFTDCNLNPPQCPAAGAQSGAGTASDTTAWSMDFNLNNANCGQSGLGPCTSSSSVPATVYVRLTRDVIGSGTDPECNEYTLVAQSN